MNDMASYRLVTFDAGAGQRAGIVTDGIVRDLAAASGEPAYATVLGVLEDWEAAAPRLAVIAANPNGPGAKLADVHLLAPLPRPGTIFCAGANYTDHVEEMARATGLTLGPDPRTLGLKAWHFIKNARTVVGPGATVMLPPTSKQVDWEVELAAVIGRRAKDVTVADALGHVAFYTVGDDLSARDLHFRKGIPPGSPFAHDWLAQKSFDGSCPMGPWLVPADEVADPQALRLGLTLNGTKRQDSSTQAMIYSLAEQISHLSEKLTLWPGDVIMTGTPAGVGTPHNEFLKSGDTVTAWVEGIGELTTQIA
jgi:2-keto-4-pentenoate hydratase/2-oxohepta-3-ene-1,7-dioic acid hydratase in catechol pathway